MPPPDIYQYKKVVVLSAFATHVHILPKTSKQPSQSASIATNAPHNPIAEVPIRNLSEAFFVAVGEADEAVAVPELEPVNTPAVVAAAVAAEEVVGMAVA